MSQAHYLRCDQQQFHDSNETAPVVASIRSPRGVDWNLCRDCLDSILDRCDDQPEAEPLYLVWAWDAGTRSCPLHHWPDVLCQDWAVEHAAMLRALMAPYRVPAT